MFFLFLQFSCHWFSMPVFVNNQGMSDGDILIQFFFCIISWDNIIKENLPHHLLTAW